MPQSIRLFVVHHSPMPTAVSGHRQRASRMTTTTFVEAADEHAAERVFRSYAYGTSIDAVRAADAPGAFTPVTRGIPAPPMTPGYAFGIAPRGAPAGSGAPGFAAPAQSPAPALTPATGRRAVPRGPHKLRPFDPCWWMYTEGGGGGAGNAPNRTVPVRAVYLRQNATGTRVLVRHADDDTHVGTKDKESWVSPGKVFPR